MPNFYSFKRPTNVAYSGTPGNTHVCSEVLACNIVVAGVRKDALVFYECRHRICWCSCFGDFTKVYAQTSSLFPHSPLPNFCSLLIWQQICAVIKIEHARRPIARHKLKRASDLHGTTWLYRITHTSVEVQKKVCAKATQK